ncbi:MAG TPA: tripartite tricarboxylate transporter substrate-binding protein [Acidimicrobiia bacterium]|nr:tripartite tricarboxylate transporter substrate-binding protein [Acidimicrobiia bacterium]
MAVEIIAGTPPGGGQDRAARAVAASLGDGVTVTNLPGRGGGNAWDRLVASPGAVDLAAVSSPTLVTNALVGVSAIDHRDLTPLALLYTEHCVLVVRPGSGLEEASVLLDAMAAGTAVVSFATALGNMNHLILAEIAGHAGAAVASLPVHVFDSAQHALADLIAGEADVAVVSAASAIAGVVESALTAVMVTSPLRLGGVFAGTPTSVELGIPCVRGTWRGLVGPPGLDQTEIDVWSHRLALALAGERWRRLLEENLWVDSHSGPEESMVFMEAERIELGRLLRRLDLVAKVGDG